MPTQHPNSPHPQPTKQWFHLEGACSRAPAGRQQGRRFSSAFWLLRSEPLGNRPPLPSPTVRFVGLLRLLRFQEHNHAVALPLWFVGTRAHFGAVNRHLIQHFAPEIHWRGIGESTRGRDRRVAVLGMR